MDSENLKIRIIIVNCDEIPVVLRAIEPASLFACHKREIGPQYLLAIFGSVVT